MKNTKNIILGSIALTLGLSASAQLPTYAINSGGSAYTDANGVVYEADNYFTSGATASTGASIGNTDDDTLYQSERYGAFSYDLPVSNGTYKVTLKYAEIYFNNPSSRLFRAKVEGAVDPVLYDIFTVAGGKNLAYDVEYEVAVSDGNLDLDFILGPQDLAKVSAILVEPLSLSAPDSYALYSGGTTTGPFLAADDTVYEDNLGSYVIHSAGFVTTQGTGMAIANTTDDALYQYSINASDVFELGLPIQDGLYRVVLRFSENKYTVNAAGDRVFSVSLEGGQDPLPYDVFAATGGKYSAYDVSYDVEVNDGELNLKFDVDAASAQQGPMLNALKVTPLPTSYAINAGGGSYTDASGLVYEADRNFDGGATASTGSSIANTDDDALYQTERYGLFDYDLPIADGDYTVTLKFAEIYFNNSSERLFRVKNEGVVDILPLTIFSSAGGKNIAYDRVYDVTVTDGELNIEMMMGQRDLPKISAILVEPKTTLPDSYAINCGGDVFTDANGLTYQADDATFYTGTSTTYSESVAIAGTEDDVLYQTQVIGAAADFDYALPIQDGTYTVTLKFAQLGSVSGFSYFNTNTEGASQVHFVPGPNTAYDYTVSGVTVTDGVLDIAFDLSYGGSPYISAILVEKE